MNSSTKLSGFLRYEGQKSAAYHAVGTVFRHKHVRCTLRRKTAKYCDMQRFFKPQQKRIAQFRSSAFILAFYPDPSTQIRLMFLHQFFFGHDIGKEFLAHQAIPQGFNENSPPIYQRFSSPYLFYFQKIPIFSLIQYLRIWLVLQLLKVKYIMAHICCRLVLR